MVKTSILIVDGQGVVIEGVKSLIRENVEFEVVGTAYDGNEAIKLVDSLRPSIVIMDISMPDLDGLETTKLIKKLFPDTKVIIYTMFFDERCVIELFKTGVSGYVLKQDPVSDIMLAINAVKAGGTYYSTIVPKLLSGYLKTLKDVRKNLHGLSHREHEIFVLLADGKSIRQIAKKLFISPKTVESHKYNIMAKLNAQTIPDLTKVALKDHLIRLS